jgi:hypothetical protein
VPIINKVSAAVFDRQAKSAGRQPSPQQLELIAKIKAMKNERDVYEVLLTGAEKPVTVRQQIIRAAKAAEVEIAVKRSPHGFYIGLMTQERTRGRGRKAKSGSQAGGPER